MHIAPLVRAATVSGHVMLASFYGAGERLAAFTASGELFRPLALTAAHRTLPIGTMLTVCLIRCARIRVNDRGPASWTGRDIDLSLGAARAIGLSGVGQIQVFP